MEIAIAVGWSPVSAMSMPQGLGDIRGWVR